MPAQPYSQFSGLILIKPRHPHAFYVIKIRQEIGENTLSDNTRCVKSGGKNVVFSFSFT